MAEYIDKRDAIDIFKQFKKRKWISMPIEQVIEIISVVPYVEVEPVKHGQWVFTPTTGRYRCSACEKADKIIPWGRPPFAYCPNCGAKMDGGEDD